MPLSQTRLSRGCGKAVAWGTVQIVVAPAVVEVGLEAATHREAPVFVHGHVAEVEQAVGYRCAAAGRCRQRQPGLTRPEEWLGKDVATNGGVLWGLKNLPSEGPLGGAEDRQREPLRRLPPRLHRQVQISNACRRAATVLPYLAAARQAGAKTLAEMAEALMARGVPAPRDGGRWSPAQVRRVLRQPVRI